MKIGISGPVMVEPLLKYLGDARRLPGEQPRGLGGTTVVFLIEELLARGHEVVVFTLDPAVEREVILTGGKLRVRIGPYRRRGRARDFFKSEREYLGTAIREEKPEVVHAHWTYEFALGAISSGVPAVVTAHDAPLNVLYYQPDAYRFMRTIMAVKAIRKAGVLTAVSPHIAKHLGMYFGAVDVEVIPNGLPESFFVPRRGRPRANPDGSITYGCAAAGFNRLRNGKVLIKAFSEARKKMNAARLRLLMFGHDHGPGEKAEKWAVKNGYAEGIEFIGHVPHGEFQARLGAQVDVLVFPALEDAFSMVVLEALGKGIPVIGGLAAGGVPYILDEGRAGMLVDMRSAGSLARAMMIMAGDGEKRTALGSAGMESAMRRFRIGAVASQYERVYLKAVLKGGGSRGPAPAGTATVRVLHILGELRASGAEVMLRVAGPRMAAFNMEAGILSTGQSIGRYAPHLEKAGYIVHHAPFEKRLRHFRTIWRLLKQGEYTVGHIHTERANFWYALLLRLAGVKNVVRTVHSTFQWSGYLRWKRSLQRKFLRCLGVRFVSVSQAVAANEQAVFRNRTEVIDNWFDGARVRPPTQEERAASRFKLGIETGELAILSIGNCSPVKNHALIIEALASLPMHVRWRYLHVGEEDGGNSERHLAGRLGVADNVLMLGFLEDILAPLHAADVFVMPSLWEGLPIAAVEALAAGVPCVLADIPAFREIAAVSGQGTWLVPPDPASIARAVLQAASIDTGKRTAMGREASRAISRRYSVDHGMMAYMKLYQGPA